MSEGYQVSPGYTCTVRREGFPITSLLHVVPTYLMGVCCGVILIFSCMLIMYFYIRTVVKYKLLQFVNWSSNDYINLGSQ